MQTIFSKRDLIMRGNRALTLFVAKGSILPNCTHLAMCSRIVAS